MLPGFRQTCSSLWSDDESAPEILEKYGGLRDSIRDRQRSCLYFRLLFSKDIFPSFGFEEHLCGPSGFTSEGRNAFLALQVDLASTNHCQFKSLPVQIIAYSNHCQYKSLPIQIIASTNHCPYKSLPIQIIASTNHCQYKPLPSQLRHFQWIFNFNVLCTQQALNVNQIYWVPR